MAGQSLGLGVENTQIPPCTPSLRIGPGQQPSRPPGRRGTVDAGRLCAAVCTHLTLRRIFLTCGVSKMILVTYKSDVRSIRPTSQQIVIGLSNLEVTASAELAFALTFFLQEKFRVVRSRPVYRTFEEGL